MTIFGISYSRMHNPLIEWLAASYLYHDATAAFLSREDVDNMTRRQGGRGMYFGHDRIMSIF